MNVLHFILREVSPFNTPYHRPFSVSSEAAASIKNLASECAEATERCTNIAETNIAGIAGKLIRPDATPECQIVVPGDTMSRRWVFILVVETRTSMHCVDTLYITGYLGNYDDVTKLGAISPSARFYMDSSVVIESRRVTANTSSGVATINRVRDQLNLVQDRAFNGENNDVNNLMTPKQLFRSYGSSFYNDGLASKILKKAAVDEGFVDLTAQSFTAVTAVQRSNATSVGFLNKIANAYVGSLDPSTDVNTEGETFKSNLKANFNEPILDNMMFYKKLKGCSEYSFTGYVTYSELLEFSSYGHASIDDVKNIFRIKEDSYVDMSSEFSKNHGRNIESVIAHILSNSVPELMIRCGYSSIKFMFSNMTVNSEFELTISSLNPILRDMPIDSNLSFFKQRMISTVLEDLLINDHMVIVANVECNIYTGITMTIDVGDGEESYAYPVYCSSLYQPILTTSLDRVYGVAHDVKAFCDELISHSPARHTPIRTSNELPLLDQPQYENPRSRVKPYMPSSDSFVLDDIFGARK